MAHWRSLIPSEFLKAGDFDGRDVPLTITRVEKKELDALAKPGRDGEPKAPPRKEKRGVVSFKQTDKTLPLNVINAASMAAMWGADYTRWVGHDITLYSGRAKLGPDEVDAIRVRGAPDLPAPIEFEIAMPRRRPVKVRLVPTGKATSGGAKQASGPDSATPALSDEEKAEIAAAEREPGED